MADEARPAPGAWRMYLELASGLGEVSRKRVRKVLKDLVGKGNATAEQLRTMTSEVLAANAANREALVKLVKIEVDRALGRVGLATMDEVNELNARVRELERELREARAGAAEPAASRTATTTPATRRTATTTPATRRTARSSTAEPGATGRGGRPAAKTTPASSSPVVKKAVRKAAPAKATKAVPATPVAKATKATKASRSEQ